MAPHLTLNERRIVAGLLHRKVSVAQIAIQLGRHRSTIHREIRRNFWHDPEVPMATGYWHMNAQNLAAARRSRQRKLIRHDGLRLAVIDRLSEHELQRVEVLSRVLGGTMRAASCCPFPGLAPSLRPC